MSISCVEDYLIFEEGEDLAVYPDSMGYLTIGVGHLVDRRKGGGITPAVSRMILDEDIAKHEAYLRYFPWYAGLSQVRKAVLISMIHQLGSLQQWPHFLEAVARQEWTTAALAMLDSEVARVQSPNRWSRAAEMMRSDAWPVVPEST